MKLLPIEVDAYRLRFLVHKCATLTHYPCSAIVAIRFGTQIKSTQICHLTADPEFEEEISFVVHMSQRDIAKEIVTIEVLNTLRTDRAAVIGEFKFMISNGFAGQPIGWNEPAYPANTVCRSVVKKWLIITNTFETPKNIKGFVNISLSVLSSGQSISASPNIPAIVMNVTQNVMRPSEVTAQYKKLYFRIYSALDLPITDVVELPEHLKITRKEHCDPFVKISYCGVEATTEVHYSNYNPQFNTDIIFNIEIPAITPIVKIQILDFDNDAQENKPISTYYLSLNDISFLSDDDNGFDPIFGPALIPLYGSPRMVGIGAYPELNDGSRDGAGYRGRLFLEMFTKPSYSVGIFANTAPTPAAAIKKSKKTLKTQMCVLTMGVMEVTMIHEEFALDKMVQFEVSVGEFGNQRSMFTEISNSRVFPEAPLYDSAKFYFIDYSVDVGLYIQCRSRLNINLEKLLVVCRCAGSDIRSIILISNI